MLKATSKMRDISLVPRPLPDFISQLPRLRDKIWEWPGNEARETYEVDDNLCSYN